MTSIRRSEDRGQRTEDRGQRTEDRTALGTDDDWFARPNVPWLSPRRLGSYVNAATALGASRLESEATNHAGCVFEAPGVS